MRVDKDGFTLTDHEYKNKSFSLSISELNQAFYERGVNNMIINTSNGTKYKFDFAPLRDHERNDPDRYNIQTGGFDRIMTAIRLLLKSVSS